MTISKLSPRTCERAREWASLHLDGELSEFEHALLGAHLEQCAECAHYVSEVDETTRTLRRAEAQRLSFPLSLPSRARRVLPLRVMSAAAAAAAVAAAVGLGTLYGSFGTTRPSTGPGLSRSAVSSQPQGEAGLIQQPKYALLMRRIGAGGPRPGIGIANL